MPGTINCWKQSWSTQGMFLLCWCGSIVNPPLLLTCILTFYTSNNGLLLEMSIFWIKAACEIGLASYGSNFASRSLSDMQFVCSYTQLEKYRLYMDVLHIKWLLMWGRFLWWFTVQWTIWLESYGPRQASHLFSETSLCVYCKPVTVLHTKQQFYCQQCIILSRGTVVKRYGSTS